MFDFNLQLFAEEEDVLLDEETMDLEDEIDLEEEEIEEDEELEEEIEEDEEYPSLDKKTKAIIKHKKEAQQLRKELEEYKEKEAQAELDKKNKERVEELQKGGKSLDEAKTIADKEMEHQKLKGRITYMELEKLETKYPGITRFSQEITKDKEALPGFTYEQIYLAKYFKQSGYDTKTQMEQELLHKAKKNKQSSLEPSNVKGTRTIKLSTEDERVYRIMKQANPKLTRKRFLELTKE